MNLELWNEAVDWIEDHPEEYDQSESGRLPGSQLCRSPCCFFGVIAMLSGLHAWGIEDLSYRVGRLLEINDSQAHALFGVIWPESWFEKSALEASLYGGDKAPSAPEAIAILRGMARDGQVW